MCTTRSMAAAADEPLFILQGNLQNLQQKYGAKMIYITSRAFARIIDFLLIVCLHFRKRGTLDCKLYRYPKFYKPKMSLVGFKTLGIFIESDLQCTNFSPNNLNIH